MFNLTKEDDSLSCKINNEGLSSEDSVNSIETFSS
jgi:hypothetical protein